MKKFISAFLVLAVAVTLAACDRGTTNAPTTTEPAGEITTAPSQVTPTEVTTTESANPTYILTTQMGQTMPTVVTTQFSLENEITTAPTTSPTAPTFDFTVPSMTAPEVIVEQKPTVPSTSASQGQVSSPSTSDGTTAPAETTKPADEQERKHLELNSFAFNSQGNLEYSYDISGWNGGVKATKIEGITVSNEGVSIRVSGYVRQNSDGISVTLYLSDLNLAPGTTVSGSIPGGSIVSAKGDQVNIACPFSATTDGEVLGGVDFEEDANNADFEE